MEEIWEADFCNKAASPGEQEVYHTPVLPQRYKQKCIRGCYSFSTGVRYMRSEGACYYALGSENGDPNLPMKTFELLYQSEFPVLEKSIPDLTQQQKEMLYHYLSQGCGGVLSYWIHNGMTQEPEEIADFIMQASIATVTVFNRK